MGDGISFQLIIQSAISIIGGGLAGSILALLFNRNKENQSAKTREKVNIIALKCEINHNKILCQYNAKLINFGVSPFIHFPTILAIKTTFDERQNFPKLTNIQTKLEWYTLSIIQVNELIDLYQKLLQAPPIGLIEKSYSILQDKIINLCKGNAKLEGVGNEDSWFLPIIIDSILRDIDSLTVN